MSFYTWYLKYSHSLLNLFSGHLTLASRCIALSKMSGRCPSHIGVACIQHLNFISTLFTFAPHARRVLSTSYQVRCSNFSATEGQVVCVACDPATQQKQENERRPQPVTS